MIVRTSKEIEEIVKKTPTQIFFTQFLWKETDSFKTFPPELNLKVRITNSGARGVMKSELGSEQTDIGLLNALSKKEGSLGIYMVMVNFVNRNMLFYEVQILN